MEKLAVEWRSHLKPKLFLKTGLWISHAKYPDEGGWEEAPYFILFDGFPQNTGLWIDCDHSERPKYKPPSPSSNSHRSNWTSCSHICTCAVLVMYEGTWGVLYQKSWLNRCGVAIMKGIVVIPNLRLSPLNHHSSQKGCINKIQICFTEIKIKGDYSQESHA